MLVLTIALLFSGCAGLQPKETQAVPAPLKETVPESFYFNIQDKDTLRYLADVDTGLLPPDRRLEVLLLRALETASAENELPKVFDRLWEEQEEIRDIINRPEQVKGFVHPLVEIYYLLSGAPVSSWRNETAERLYKEALINIQPHQVSGYALHFYTLALLKTGKFNAALPFLYRLQNFTPAQIYVRDLTTALEYAVNGGADHVACELMADICRNAARDNLNFPDDALKAAIITLIKAGKLEPAREVLLPVIRENPLLETYSFVKLLKEAPQNPDTDSMKHLAENPFPTFEAGEVRIEVQVIKAGQRSNYIDPALGGIGRSLKETLNFSSFTLVCGKILHLGIGEKGILPIAAGQSMRVVPRSLTPKLCRIEVAIINGDREVFNTLVESVDGGITTIGGPQLGDVTLLLRITTFIIETKVGRQHPSFAP